MTNKKSLLLLLILSTVLVYGSTLFNGFVWDDFGLILEDPLVKTDDFSGIFSRKYYSLQPEEERGRFRPVRHFTFILDHWLYGENAWGYHLTNLFLHAVNVLLVYIVAGLLFKTNTAALLGALLFAVHPVHVESVAWVKNRSDLLCSIFFLVSVWSLFKLKGSKKIIAVSVSFLLAFLSKETAAVLPALLMILVGLCWPAEKKKKEFYWIVPLLLAAAGMLLLKEYYWKRELSPDSNIIFDAYIRLRIVI
ncbi:MAG TPA: glycosyltransferase family 39 protein, partial [bacterium]|nr:glycosyltransferase family 39 protein [bacterium]